jgi:hypothetical protein
LNIVETIKVEYQSRELYTVLKWNTGRFTQIGSVGSNGMSLHMLDVSQMDEVGMLWDADGPKQGNLYIYQV